MEGLKTVQSVAQLPQWIRSRKPATKPQDLSWLMNVADLSPKENRMMIVKPRLITAAAVALLLGTQFAHAQRSRGGGGGPPNPSNMGDVTVSPVKLGEAGIAWYSTWDLALKEAKRSNRPILFMSAASQCNGVPGAF